MYYFIKPAFPRWLQIYVRRRVVQWKRKAFSNIWPIDRSSATPPQCWSGWPEGKQFALVLTHDVETIRGQNNCHALIKLEQLLGFKSSFNFVPERYAVSPELRKYLIDKGFEVGVHGLCHDGKLYNSREIFLERAHKINSYLSEWNAVGFRSPSMQHNLEWILDLNIQYDASTFDTDPFEPQSDGVSTIFPFWVSGNSFIKGYVELPYTLSQDFTLFVLMKEKGIDIWKKKLDWIVQHGGMALINTHPDYMNFGDQKITFEEYPAKYYEDLLKYVLTNYQGKYWNPLPMELADFWSKHYTNT